MLHIPGTLNEDYHKTSRIATKLYLNKKKGRSTVWSVQFYSTRTTKLACLTNFLAFRNIGGAAPLPPHTHLPGLHAPECDI